jgi:hypothetical protein
MFTHPVSWLLVACVPGLLMLAALGLGRLEREITGEPVIATDADELPPLAEAVDLHTLAREGMPEALEYLHRQEQRQLECPPAGAHGGGRHAAPVFAANFCGSPEPGLSEPRHALSSVNPQFKTPRHVNRV